MKNGQSKARSSSSSSGAGDDGREREQDHHGRDQHGPRIDRQLAERHARRTREQHANHDLDRAGNGRDLDKADAQQPPVGAGTGRMLAPRQRRIHEPTAIGRDAKEDGAEEHEPADRVGPERVSAKARERQVACADHPRQHVHRDRLDHGHGKQEHHHRAVHREHLVVCALAEQRVLRDRQLRAHQQGERSSQHEEQQRGENVEEPDLLVLHRRDDAPAARRLPCGAQTVQFVRVAGAAYSATNPSPAGRAPVSLQIPEVGTQSLQCRRVERGERWHPRARF